MDFQIIFSDAKEWAYEAGTTLKQALLRDIKVEYKSSAADLVTEMDKEIETFFVDKIKSKYPKHFILGEEGAVTSQAVFHPGNEIVWLVDPIDGTTNFIHQKRNFCVSVAIFEQGQPVVGIIYDPIADEMFHTLSGDGVYLNDKKLESPDYTPTYEQALIAMNHLWLAPNDYLDERPLQQMAKDIRGFRCIGSAALELAYVAAGRLDGAIFARLGPWDFGAAYVLLREQGIEISTTNGEDINVFKHSSVLTASKNLYKKIKKDYVRSVEG